MVSISMNRDLNALGYDIQNRIKRGDHHSEIIESIKKKITRYDLWTSTPKVYQIREDKKRGKK